MSESPILVWGEALVDLVPRDAGVAAYDAVLGGSGWNTALTLARQGAAVSLAASFSTDALGRRFRDAAAAEGIDLSLSRVTDAPTPLAAVEPLDAAGQASYRFHLDGSAFDQPPSVAGNLDRFAHLHVTSFAVTRGAAGEAALALMADSRAAGLCVSYDLNIRPPALPSAGEARALIEARVALADVVKGSSEDVGWLYGDVDEPPLDIWRQLGPAIRIATMGDAGSRMEWGDTAWIHGFAKGTTVVDTIGAGDAFMAAFLATFLRGGGVERLYRGFEGDSYDYDLAQDLMDEANTCAAATCAVRGCDPPRLR